MPSFYSVAASTSPNNSSQSSSKSNKYLPRPYLELRLHPTLRRPRREVLPVSGGLRPAIFPTIRNYENTGAVQQPERVCELALRGSFLLVSGEPAECVHAALLRNKLLVI